MPTGSDGSSTASVRKARGVLAVVVAAVALAALAVAFGQGAALGAIHLYQRALAPVAEAAGVRCRMTPSCSHYAEAVIARDGLLRGGLKAAARITRCGPWTPAGTEDLP
jgi:putative membrane protein insertion efficiency factor